MSVRDEYDMTAEERRVGMEEASFHAAVAQLAEYVQEHHGVTVSFKEDSKGRLVLRIVGFREVVYGLHSDDQLGHLPHMTITLGAKP